MGGQWEAVARRSLRELPPRYTRHRPPTLCILVHTDTHTYIQICTFVCVSCSCSVRRVELVDDPGDVNDFRGKFSPQKWQNSPFAPPAGYPGPELTVALINDLPMYIFRPPPAHPLRTLRQIYEVESTDCAGKNIRDHRPASAIFHDSHHCPELPATGFAAK